MIVTLDDVRKGVMSKIANFKNADTPIYGEGIPQNFREPCFYIRVVTTSHTQELGPRYHRKHLFDVHYFPAPGNDVNEQNLTMVEKLYAELEYIEVNDRLTQGVDMHHEVVDKVLHFFISYNFTAKKQVPVIPSMENLYQERTIKSG